MALTQITGTGIGSVDSLTPTTIQLGGSGSANALDDYEEGTWTLTVSDSSGNNASPTSASGRYTKIGNIVYASVGTISNINTSGLVAEDILRLNGLPYIGANGFHTGNISINRLVYDSTRTRVYPSLITGQTYMRITKEGNDNNTAYATPSDLTSGGSDFLALSIVYRTT